MSFFRIFIEKKDGFAVEAKELKEEISHSLQINKLKNLRVINIYELDGTTKEEENIIIPSVLSEINVDRKYDSIEELSIDKESIIISYEPVPGQFDQRKDSAIQCIKLILPNWNGKLQTGKMVILDGDLTDNQISKIETFLINPLECRIKDLSINKISDIGVNLHPTERISNFTSKNSNELENLRTEMGMAMSLADLKHVQEYFKNEEKRDPSITEIKVLDTYWSDHCRHTTFETEIEDIKISEGRFKKVLDKTLSRYFEMRTNLHDNKKPITLMDLATICGKSLRKDGKLDDLDLSEEINACSVKVDIDVNGKKEPWLLMFKNETHNHPTEIEPFGGASTCIGGAIRDPLSGRSYVYQAMRITGSDDPTQPIETTIEGKLPQKTITKNAARGYSSYGNQIGLATSFVREIYHPGYRAKRMEVGAVVGAAPADQVVRFRPEADDRVILIGGRTGRDGCGGATGSSKAHTIESQSECGSEVQKGNAPEERKIQRLFRNKEVTSMIRRCNDFGAGGVSVAIGELADGLKINLDKVPVKYLGLNGTELAISESQERMAVVVSASNSKKMIEMAAKENLEAVEVAVVTEEKRLVMEWQGDTIVSLDRSFLDTNGVRASSKVNVVSPDESFNPLKREVEGNSIKEKFLNNSRNLNVCSQKGLVEMFDSTIGASTVHMPYGGKNQLSESECSIHKFPLENGETKSVSIMSSGYNPVVSEWSPFHGSSWAVVESLTRLAAVGGKWEKARLSFQEYFRRMDGSEEVWGAPFAALLGALNIQMDFESPAIGGKDSMSGSFHDIHVPPTLISFAVTTGTTDHIVSSDFKKVGNYLYILKHTPTDNYLPDTELLKKNFSWLSEQISNGKIKSSISIKEGGLAEALFKGALGNSVGVTIDNNSIIDSLFDRDWGSIVIESEEKLNFDTLIEIGKLNDSKDIILNDSSISLDDIYKSWIQTLEPVFHDLKSEKGKELPQIDYNSKSVNFSGTKCKPKVVIPVFPGTNCEYDTKKAFVNAGAEAEIVVFRNRTAQDIEDSITTLSNVIKKSQIMMLVGGFSAGDEPDGSGKFIANILKNSKISDSVHSLLDKDGLILGICNGFQALVKSGLLPEGRISMQKENSPTLTYNNINRHISRMVSTRISSVKSPWLNECSVGEIHNIAVSHGEGRFVADSEWIKRLKENGQVTFQYVDFDGNPTMDPNCNPNGSVEAIEGICSSDGRILGKMGHSERFTDGTLQNVYGNKDQKLFVAGVKYFS